MSLAKWSSYKISASVVVTVSSLSFFSAAQAQTAQAGVGVSSQIDFSWAPNPTAIYDSSGKDWSHSDFCGISHIMLSYARESMGACSVYYDHSKGVWMMQSGGNQGWQQCSATCVKK